MQKVNFKKGISIVEILIAIPIFTIVLGSLIIASNLYLSTAGDSLRTAQGAYIAQEGIEAVKIMRDINWTNISSLTNNANYYLYFDVSSTTNNIWKSTTTASSINSFVRTFKVNSVNRDANGKIVTSGGTLDTNSEKVTVSVSWKAKNGTTIPKILSTYITNIL